MSEETDLLSEDSPFMKVMKQEPLKFVRFDQKLYDNQQAFKNRYKLWELYKKEK
jgi:hypothetical protein